jgi:cell division transport system permease protein
MFLVLGRTIKQSLVNFVRNGWLSVAAITILVLSLYVIGILFVIIVTANSVLENVEDKINISVYFKSDVSEERIFEIKNDLAGYSEIKSVNYISKDQALEDFKRSNANEPVIIKALEEIGENPLLASLVIKANNPNEYQNISDYIGSSVFSEDVSRVNYQKNKEIIGKLNNIIFHIKRIGIAWTAMFSAISILIIFNTIRIAIYSRKQEIEVMRLVGASNTFIRLPFIFEGIIYGLVATILSTGFLFLTIKFVAPYVSSVVPSQNLINFYLDNIQLLLGIQAGVGVFLGVFSSLVAVRKYLKI